MYTFKVNYRTYYSSPLSPSGFFTHEIDADNATEAKRKVRDIVQADWQEKHRIGLISRIPHMSKDMQAYRI